MPAPTTGSELLELVEKSGLYESDQLHTRLSEVSDLTEKPVNLATQLIKHGILTKFQAKLLLAGKYRGFRIGPYVLSDMIGQGGMGAVYSAKHLQLNRQVAIKVLTPGKDDNMKLAIDRFLREARAAAALDHPNIVRLHDVGQFGQTHYLVMEFVDGQTLEQIVEKKGSLPCQKAVEYICQAAAGLQHAHEKGFIHRDIKPSNLILTKDGTVKLLDMGLARSSDERDKLTGQIDLNIIVGTADFISPEQAVNDPDIDIRSDIYSLGATFFMLVTGGSPFKGNTAQKLVQHQVKDAPSLTRMDKTLPKELADVVAKMMAKKKEHRFRTPADVIAAFSPWLANSGKVVAGLTQTHAGSSDGSDTMDNIVASSTKRITKSILRAAENPRSKLLTIGGVAAGIVTVALGIGYWMWGGSKPDSNANVKAPNPQQVNSTTNQIQTVPVNSTVEKPAVATVPGKSPGAILSFTPTDLLGHSFTVEGLEPVQGIKPPLPEYLNLFCWKPESTGEFTISDVNGVPAIRFASRSGPPTAQLRFEIEKAMGAALKPGKEYEFRCYYKTNGGASGRMSIVTSKYQYLKGQNLQDTGGTWKSESFTYTRGDEILTCNFDSSNITGSGFISLAKFEVIDREAASQAKPSFSARFDGLKPAKKRVEKPGTAFNQFAELNLPIGVRLNHHQGTAVAEYAIADVNGQPALEMNLVSGRLGSQCHFDFDRSDPMPAGTPGTIRLTYQFEGMGSGNLAIEEGAKPYTKHHSTTLAATHGQWKTVDVPFSRPSTTNPISIIVNVGYSRGETDQARLRIRSLEVFRDDHTADRLSEESTRSLVNGAILYELPVISTSPFEVTMEKGVTPSGTLPSWPGVQLHAWKDGSVGQFRLSDRGEGTELSMTNLNATTSAQLMVQFEFEMAQKLTVGRKYKIIVDYRTINDGAGHLIMQSDNYSVVQTISLPETAGKWNLRELTFTRAEGKPIRFGINCTSVGEGNWISIRKLSIVELK